MFKLFDYFRSSAGFRVRIALNLKQIDYERTPVHLLKDGGQQFKNDYTIINPQMFVPSLQIPTGEVLTQSLAIIEYLDEMQPTPPLLPQNPILRAKVRAIALSIACDIHPINNLRILKYLKHELNVNDEQKDVWYAHWIKRGFEAIENLLADNTDGHYCFGQAPTLADVCLIPQVYNAIRYKVSLSEYPRISRIYDSCLTTSAFANALPEKQTDVE